MSCMSHIVICCHIENLGLCEFLEDWIYRYRGSSESLAEHIDTRERISCHTRYISSEDITIAIRYRIDDTIELIPRDRQIEVGISIARDSLDLVDSCLRYGE